MLTEADTLAPWQRDFLDALTRIKQSTEALHEAQQDLIHSLIKEPGAVLPAASAAILGLPAGATYLQAWWAIERAVSGRK